MNANINTRQGMASLRTLLIMLVCAYNPPNPPPLSSVWWQKNATSTRGFEQFLCVKSANQHASSISLVNADIIRHLSHYSQRPRIRTADWPGPIFGSYTIFAQADLFC